MWFEKIVLAVNEFKTMPAPRLLIILYGLLVVLFSGGCSLYIFIFTLHPLGPFEQFAVYAGCVSLVIGFYVFYVAWKWSWPVKGAHENPKKWYRGISFVRWLFILMGGATMFYFGWVFTNLINGPDLFFKALPVAIFFIGLCILVLALKAGRE